jgi:WD40 repeat protein
MIRCILAVAVVLISLGGRSQQNDPILMPNTEMHIGAIRGIGTDAAGKFMVTCSDDKMAKLWTTEGAFIKNFQLPLNHGKDGMLYCCDISPDGKYAVFGGWTGIDFTGSYSVYVFDVAEGKLLKSLGGHLNVIFKLAFSPDGRWLVAALGGDQGIRVYNTASWLEINNPDFKSYTNNTYAVAFAKDGRLATASFDGKIRLYDADFRLVREKKVTGGKSPFDLDFSPDGKKIALAYEDPADVEIYDSKSLKLDFKPDCRGGEDISLWSHFNNVAYSEDGRYLYGAGYKRMLYEGAYLNVIRVWDKEGKGMFIDIPVAANSVLDMKPVGTNDILYSSASPELGKVSDQGVQHFYKESENKVFAAIDKSHFKINEEGTMVAFTPFGKTPLVFNLNERRLEEDKGQYGGLKSYRDKSNNISLTQWESSLNPKLNGYDTQILGDGELSRCVDIADDESSFVVGGEYEVYCYDRDWNFKWSVKGTTAWMINISGNGKVVAVGYSDGTIKWYRISDGELLLTLLVYGEDNKWMAYTKNGYYDCSPGAESLMGWHINNGAAGAASFYPVYQFRSMYYQPDVVNAILRTYDETDALSSKRKGTDGPKQENTTIRAALPPTVTIISPVEGSESSTGKILLKYKVTSPNNEPVSGIKIRVNGEEVTNKKGVQDMSEKDGIEIMLNNLDNKISVVAENTYGFSAPAILNVVWKGKQENDLYRPKLYVLAVGVSKYNNQSLRLELAAKDAKDFSNALLKQKDLFYSDVIVRQLLDGDATKDNVLDGLDWLQKQATHRDIVVMYFSGHGVNDPAGNFYYLPVNADLGSMKRTCVNYTEIKGTLTSLPCKVLLFADACHSGNIMGTRRDIGDVTGHLNELASAENGVVVFTSSTGKEFSLEKTSWGNGAFTKALIEGLEGHADFFKKGKISIKALDLYVSDRVKELTDGQQHPTAIIPESIPDFPIAIPVKK